jgi:formylglycine-generating enzyme required for sulfatase activity
MHTPVTLLTLIGKAVLDTSGGTLKDESFVDVLPEVAQQVWAQWQREQSEAQRRAEVDGLVRAAPEGIAAAVAEVVAGLTVDRPPAISHALESYLSQVPVTVRHAFRRLSDPSGNSVPSGLPLDKAEDLLAFLPTRLPRFRPGDVPLPGVDWQLVELLGVGGFGEVWKATNPNLASAPAVALKFCLDPTSARALRNEAQLLDRLMLQGKHPGIVTLRQTYLSAEPPCLEYEYIPGGNLAGVIHEWHRSHRAPNPLQVAQIVRRLAKIVAFAHRLEPPIVHRDLKPANILVQKMPDSTLSLRIADFGNGGVAAYQAIRQTLRGATQAQLLVSSARGAYTPLYASPQQMRGSEADPRDDVYALGVIWYQLLNGDLSTGRPGGTRWPKRLMEQGMPQPLVELLGSCLEDNPDDRPRSALALAEKLTELLHTADPESAPRPSEAQARAMPKRITNSIHLHLTLVPAGAFQMGSPTSEPERGIDEGPQHEVTITHPFYMGVYPVTQGQYEGVMGNNPSYLSVWKGGNPDFPVENISWYEAVEFCHKLSELPAEKAAGRSYRLPTEAEWEYACRASLPMPFTSGVTLSSREANFNGNYPYGMTDRGPYLERTTKVGSYPPNPFGLYDMHGNVWEWCTDYYDRNYYKSAPRYDPPGPTTGNLRVVRGGSCFNIGRFCRAAYRFGISPVNKDIDVGMRVVMEFKDDTGQAQ